MKNMFDFTDNNENVEFMKVLDDIIYDEIENIDIMKDMEIDKDIINKHLDMLVKLKRIKRRLLNKSCKNFIDRLFLG